MSIAPAAHAVPPQDCSLPSRGITPLDDLAGRYWQGVEGGLYPGGTNACPEDHLQAGRKIAKSIVPLGVDGSPASDGIVGVAAIGFSFTHQIFETLQELAATDGELDPALRLIDATARGHDLEDLRDPANDYWLTLLPAQLANAGVTAEQIQVVWVMEGARFQPAPFPDHVDLFADDWTSLLNVLRLHLPNVQLAFLSPVHWQGYSWFAPYDEPFYFEQGFAVREVIARQLAGAPELAYDLPGGTAPAPWLAWGPYFWTDGEEPRSDGLALDCADFLWEGSHLSASGRDKLSPRLLHFLKSHRACTPWSIVPGSSPAERMAEVELLGGASSGVRGEPRLCGSALPTVPYDGDYQLLARNALPSGSGVVVLGEQLLPGDGIAIGAGFLRVVPAFLLPIHFGAKGNGALVMGEIPSDAALLDLCVYAQLAVFDSSAAGDVALSQALELRLGD
ncbi:MAG: hypothetical protein JNL90_18955 [Planctomycetes bacterium]|nr:hypothetical protein [Planctomycetota bacterium]